MSTGFIRDNSFLIEEAYNQEENVIQHIFTVVRDRRESAWLGAFTDEWPLFGERHQLSITIPFSIATGPSAGTGIGDVFLNYRYQWSKDELSRPAIAPRVSLLLPTGDRRRGLGSDSVGVQWNLPVSKQIAPPVAVHANLGATVVPRAYSSADKDRHDLVSLAAGGSVIWGPWEAVNFLLEVVGSRDPEVTAGGRSHVYRLFCNPGVRIAWNSRSGVQWVGGIGAPVGLADEAGSVAVLLYLSVEHPVTGWTQRERGRADR